jgi:hypothetical protein
MQCEVYLPVYAWFSKPESQKLSAFAGCVVCFEIKQLQTDMNFACRLRHIVPSVRTICLKYSLSAGLDLFQYQLVPSTRRKLRCAKAPLGLCVTQSGAMHFISIETLILYAVQFRKLQIV